MARRKNNKEALAIWQEAIAKGDDGVRGLVEYMVQMVLEQEMTRFIGAQPYERTSERNGHRNGYKPRKLITRVGTLDLQVPQDREGCFSTQVFERYQRSEKALVLAVIEMYLNGVSTRKVKKITEALCAVQLRRSQVSELTKGLDEQIDLWRNRRLEENYAFLIIDARYEKSRCGGQVVSKAALVVVGINEQGYREPLGTWVCDSENESTWSEVFGELYQRGLSGVGYIVSDNHKGLRQAILRYFQGVVWQRCSVHFVRNVLKRIRPQDKAWIVELLREVTQAP